MHTHPLIEVLEARIAPATILVTNVHDSGAGSLRSAIAKANATAETDLIKFFIIGRGPHVIDILAELPALGGGITIDGNTQPGNGVGPYRGHDIALSGPDALLISGLTMAGDENLVRGLVIGGFAEAGIKISGNNNVVEYCSLGSGRGLVAEESNGMGVIVTGDRNSLVGNGIWNNTLDGILLAASSPGERPEGNVIHGNSLGKADRLSPVILNGRDSIRVEASANLEIAGNFGQSFRLIGPATQDISIASNIMESVSVEGGAHAVRLESNQLTSVMVPDGFGVEIGPNRISNIDLGPAGPPPNDPLDADSGANDLLNTPFVTSVISHFGATRILGGYDGLPDTELRILIGFSRSASTWFLGETNVHTDANGHAAFEFVGDTLRTVDSILAWAVDPATGNSSEMTGAGVDSSAVVRIADAQISERDSDAVLNFKVRLSQPASGTVTVPISFVDGTAEHDADFLLTTSTATFTSGQIETVVPVIIKGEQTREAVESFQLVLGTPTGAGLDAGHTTATIQIRDDDHSLVVSPDRKSAAWIDADGDRATLKSNQAIFDPAEFTFVDSTTVSGGDQLAKLDLRGFVEAGVVPDLAFTVKRDPLHPGSDGRVDVGFIEATGIDLGTVSLPGDLGQIRAGENDGDVKPGVGTLVVASLGTRGLDTQAAADFPTETSRESVINGGLGTLKVSGDVNGAHLRVAGTPYAPTDKRSGAIGKVTIGGNLIGGDGAWSGAIETGGWIGSLSVGGDIVGGNGAWSGAVRAGAGIGTVKVVGDVKGGTGLSALTPSFVSATGSGSISSGGSMGRVTIGGDLHGGDSDRSGSIFTEGGDHADIAAVTITGELSGHGLDPDGGAIFTGIASSGRLGLIKAGRIVGTAADDAVQLTAAGRHVVATKSDALAFAGLTVAGDVSDTLIRVGYALDGTAVTPYASAGGVKVGGEWTASSILVGAAFDNGGSRLVPAAGVLHRSEITSIIASIRIDGEVHGTVAPGDLFGFIARKIVSVRAHGQTLPLTANGSSVLPDHLLVPNTADVVVLEVL